MSQEAQEYGFSRRQVTLGLVAIFAVYGTMAYFLQTLTVARPKMAADLDGMSLYAWAVSIPSLFSAFVTLIFGKLSDIHGRRIMLLVSVILLLVGTILSAISPTFTFLIFASVVVALGTGAMMPLVFSVVGDLFPPAQRGKWIGLLNIPVGFFALVGPTLGGWVTDNLNWRYLFWLSIPLLIVCLVTVPVGVPSIVNRGAKGKIDVLGCVLIAIASSATILGLSFAGTHHWKSLEVLGLLSVSVIFWIAFFVAEARIKAPILDPAMFRNRAFVTVAVATLLSFFGQMAILMYFPMFLQGVQGISATVSGQIITPYSVLMAFIGVPVGFLLTKSRRFKWMYIVGFGILTADMFGIIFFTSETPVVWSVIAATLAGLGLGAVPTINTMVVQNAVPKRLLGVAMGAFFFFISMGVAVSPAVLGSAMTFGYNKTLSNALPKGLERIADEATMASLSDSDVLLSEPAMAALEDTFRKHGAQGEALLAETVQAIRSAMESGLRNVFWLSAITMLLAFLLISTVPESSMEEKVPEEIPEPVGAE
ncbi:MAG: MFS transporter [Acidobacteria bacterium]|nr:MFS transporter [Acidobacteriota bacterium]